MNTILSQTQCMYAGVSLLLLALLWLELSLRSVVGVRTVSSANCCCFAPNQTVIEILILAMLVNQSRNTEKLLSSVPSGGYCSPCCPRAPPGPWHGAGCILHVPHRLQSWGRAVFSTSASTCSVLPWAEGTALVLYL